MSLTSDGSSLSTAEDRLAFAQAQIRALTARGALSARERLELARWQRAWLDAWRDLVVRTAARER